MPAAAHIGNQCQLWREHLNEAGSVGSEDKVPGERETNTTAGCDAVDGDHYGFCQAVPSERHRVEVFFQKTPRSSTARLSRQRREPAVHQVGTRAEAATRTG